MSTNIGNPSAMITSTKSIDRGDRLPADVFEQAVWLPIRFPLSLRMVEDLLAARGIIVSHEPAKKPCGAGQRRSAGPAPARSVGARLRSATNGISTWSCSINGKMQCHVRAVDADGERPRSPCVHVIRCLARHQRYGLDLLPRLASPAIASTLTSGWSSVRRTSKAVLMPSV